jgi:hypothetical protein
MMDYKLILQSKTEDHLYKFITVLDKANALDCINWVRFNYPEWDVQNLRKIIS